MGGGLLELAAPAIIAGAGALGVAGYAATQGQQQQQQQPPTLAQQPPRQPAMLAPYQSPQR